MAKKKPVKKPVKKPEPKLKSLIRNYVSSIGELVEEISIPQLEFGFLFYYPKGKSKKSNGEIVYRGRPFEANKPKTEDFIIIYRKTDISPNHVKYLEANKDLKNKVYDEIIKHFLIIDVGYSVDKKQNSYTINERVYPDKNNHISKEQFFKTIRRMLHADFYGIMVIQKECSGKIEDKDVKKGFESTYHT